MPSVEEETPSDAWSDFLDDIDAHAVETGIEDYSLNHEYYLYGGVKRG